MILEGDGAMEHLISVVNVKVDSNIKKQATEIFNDLGLNMSTAINMFLTQVVKQDRIPFEIKNHKPNRKLRKALKEADTIVSGKIKRESYKNTEELFKALDSEA